MHRGSWDLKEFSSLSLCKANNHPLEVAGTNQFFHLLVLLEVGFSCIYQEAQVHTLGADTDWRSQFIRPGPSLTRERS